MSRILVVEDDPSIQLGVKMSLEREGYDVAVAEDGQSGLSLALESSWDLVILDVMLPRLNGYEVLSQLRQAQPQLPVLILSAKSREEEKVLGLDLGAEDYVTKPFGVQELLARVRAALRRRDRAAQSSAPLRWSFGDIAIDPDAREVRRRGELVELTATEFNVLAALVQARGRALSRQQIFVTVWGPSHHGTHRTIDNFVGQLRAKLEDDPSEPKHLLTVRGVGYRLAF